MIELNKEAETFFSKKLEKENLDIELKIENQWTETAKIKIFYFNKNKKKIECIKKYKKFSIYTEKKFIDSLENTKIEYIKINGKEKLVIKTPNIKKKNEVIKLKKEIQKIINEEINTKLEMHDGKIEIIEIKNNILLIKFLGGCQGCSMVNTTLTNIVTETIKKKFKNIEEIHDITNHQNKENAYIK